MLWHNILHICMNQGSDILLCYYIVYCCYIVEISVWLSMYLFIFFRKKQAGMLHLLRTELSTTTIFT